MSKMPMAEVVKMTHIRCWDFSNGYLKVEIVAIPFSLLFKNHGLNSSVGKDYSVGDVSVYSH